MSTPRPKYFCPRCRAAFDVDSNFCGRCGADMHRASRLQRAQQLDEDSTGRAPTITHSEQRLATMGTQVGIAPLHAQPAPQTPRERRGSSANDPWLGGVVDGRYRVIDIVGRGGMGVVYKVEHQRMGKIAAMKVLHRDLAGDREVIGRFQREAEAVSRLTHPNTVQVFDFGTAQGALYLVMEYVRGLDIGSLIDRDGPMTFERAAVLFDQICAALSEAHELGVVHRDLKPENILVTRAHGGQDFAKVLDFGLAKLAEREEIASSSVTGRGSIVGTPYYMSPEQIRGEEQVDARSDIYSLGALMYRVLTGCHVFTATSPVGVLTKHLTEPVTTPSLRAPAMQIPPEVDDIVMTALKKPPAERFQSAHELEERLGAVYGELYEHTSSGRRPMAWRGRTTSGAISARAAAVPDPVDDELSIGFESERRLRRSDLDQFERSIRRRRWLGFVTLPLLIAAAGGGAYGYARWRAEQPRVEESERNDVAADATLIASGVPVSGTIGQRMDATRADRDHFRLVEEPAAGGGDALGAEVTALPNIDIALSLVDGTGRVLALRDEGGMGAPERLRAHRVRGPVVLMVTEAKSPTGMPTENVSDRYRLTARLVRAPHGIEVEPDDTGPDAVPLAPGAAVNGWLDHRGDVDVYRVDGPAARYTVALTSVAPATVSLRGAAVKSGAAVELPAGAMLEVKRT
ncbi:MAG TPA: serine/threonine-protein kinase, partial [Kofleriaceae bacterium]|nr:serine/threonine-protein kinase [Kofleriaceae bacterium]